MMERQQSPRRAQPDPRSLGGQRGEQDWGRWNHAAICMKVVFVDPRNVEAEPLAVAEKLQEMLVKLADCAVGRRKVRRQREYPEPHLTTPLQRAPPID